MVGIFRAEAVELVVRNFSGKIPLLLCVYGSYKRRERFVGLSNQYSAWDFVTAEEVSRLFWMENASSYYSSFKL